MNIDSLTEAEEIVFRRREGIDVDAVPLLAQVFEVSRKSIQRIRELTDLHPAGMERGHVRLIDEERWKEGMLKSKRPSFRHFAIGAYKDAEEACFLPHYKTLHYRSPIGTTQRRESAKILVHEAVHYGSQKGIDNYSTVLNEGMTETIAREIFTEKVGPHCMGISKDPIPVYPEECKIWEAIQRSKPHAVESLEKSFWRSEPETAREIITEHFGDGIAAALAGKEKTIMQLRGILAAVSLTDEMIQEIRASLKLPKEVMAALAETENIPFNQT